MKKKHMRVRVPPDSEFTIDTGPNVGGFIMVVVTIGVLLWVGFRLGLL